MTATKNQPHTHYQDIHTAIPLTPTRCHPTAQSQLVTALAREVRLGAAVLEDIEQHGPAQAVWVPLAGGKTRPWTEL